MSLEEAGEKPMPSLGDPGWSEPGLEPRTFLPWGHSANHHTALFLIVTFDHCYFRSNAAFLDVRIWCFCFSLYDAMHIFLCSQTWCQMGTQSAGDWTIEIFQSCNIGGVSFRLGDKRPQRSNLLETVFFFPPDICVEYIYTAQWDILLSLHLFLW